MNISAKLEYETYRRDYVKEYSVCLLRFKEKGLLLLYMDLVIATCVKFDAFHHFVHACEIINSMFNLKLLQANYNDLDKN